MNTTFQKGWNSNLYLDTLGSVTVIAASIVIFLVLAISGITDVIPANEQFADVCLTERTNLVDLTDQRPANAARHIEVACV